MAAKFNPKGLEGLINDFGLWNADFGFKDKKMKKYMTEEKKTSCWMNNSFWPPIVMAIIAVALISIIVFVVAINSAKADPYSWAMAEKEKDYPVELKIPSGDGQLTINLKTGIVEYYNTTLDEASLAFWNYAMGTFPWVKRQIIREAMAAREKAIARTK